MSVNFIGIYLMANALIVLALLILMLVTTVSAKIRSPVSYRQQMRLGYGLLIVALISPLGATVMEGVTFLPMSTEVWSAPSMQDIATTGHSVERVTISAAGLQANVRADFLSQSMLLLSLIGIGLALGRILVGVRATTLIVRRGHLLKRSGALQVVVTEAVLVPFSCWILGKACIVVPAAMLLRPTDLRIAIRHEGQHHRNGDTRIIYALELLRGVFLLNPAVHLLLQRIRALQEFACDEALVLPPRVTPNTYCDCLVSVSQDAARGRAAPICLSMAEKTGTSLLSRRVRAVLEKPREYLKHSKVLLIYLLAGLIILAAGFGLTSSIYDRRVPLDEALEMAALAQTGGAFPIQVNAQVLAELNRLVGTPDGRAFLHSALQRMVAYEPMISAQLRQKGLPLELLAVPLVESGYRNFATGPEERDSAGIWMFIVPTAKRFGLTIADGRDERLDVASETQAALKMLSDLHTEFGDWGLALLAYNGGTALVKRAINEGGATDAFMAARMGYENDPGYIERISAALIVLKNRRRLGLPD
jgi:membrane-bound lytic murein transglycosylase D